MAVSGVIVRCRRLAALTAVCCATFLSLGADAAQSNSPSSQTSVEGSPAEKLSEFQRDITQLKNEFGLRDEVSRLRKELEERSRPKADWVEAAPWVTLAIVGLGFTIAWLMLNWRERVLNWQKQPDPKTLDGLAKRVESLDGQVSKLGDKINEMGNNVSAVNGNLNELWKALAIGRSTGGRDPER